MAKNKLFLGVGLGITSILFLVAPMCVWFYIKRKEYFEPSQSADMAWGLIIGLVFVLLMLIGVFKEIDKRTSILVWLFVLLGMVYFLEPIIKDLFYIILSAIIGYLLFIPLWAISKRTLKFYNAYKDEKVRVEARAEAESATVLRNINSIR